jgi:hypothetical protein
MKPNIRKKEEVAMFLLIENYVYSAVSQCTIILKKQSRKIIPKQLYSQI